MPRHVERLFGYIHCGLNTTSSKNVLTPQDRAQGVTALLETAGCRLPFHHGPVLFCPTRGDEKAVQPTLADNEARCATNATRPCSCGTVLDIGALLPRTLLSGVPIQVTEEIAYVENRFALAGTGLTQVDNANIRSGRAVLRKHGVKVSVPQSGMTAHFAVWWNCGVTIWVFCVLTFLHCNLDASGFHPNCMLDGIQRMNRNRIANLPTWVEVRSPAHQSPPACTRGNACHRSSAQIERSGSDR